MSNTTFQEDDLVDQDRLDFGMSYAGGAIAWRLPIAVQLIFAIVVIILLFGLPESPRYLPTETVLLTPA